MATTYRWVVKTDHFKTRDMMPPSGKMTVPRASKKAEAEALEKFVELAKRNPPEGENASAWLEESRPRNAPRTIVRMRGRPKTSTSQAEWWDVQGASLNFFC